MNNKIDADLIQFLESMVNLNALDRMTTDLDNELKDSQAVMNEIKGMIDALPAKVGNVTSEADLPDNNGLRHEDLSNFLAAGTPQLLMPDMDVGLDVDLDDVIGTMKSYVEDLKKTLTQSEPETPERILTTQFESLDLEQYASSLDQFSKRLSVLKLNKNTELSTCNTELEAKLTVLCDDVNMFTQMIQSKTTLSEANKNWSPAQQTTNALDYDNVINRLLADINSVSYLLLTKK